MKTDAISINGHQVELFRSESLKLDASTGLFIVDEIGNPVSEPEQYGFRVLVDTFQATTAEGKTFRRNLYHEYWYKARRIDSKQDNGTAETYAFMQKVREEEILEDIGSLKRYPEPAIPFRTILGQSRISSINGQDIPTYKLLAWQAENSGLPVPGHVINSFVGYICQLPSVFGEPNPIHVPNSGTEKYSYIEPFDNGLQAVQPLVVFELTHNNGKAEFNITEQSGATYSIDGGDPVACPTGLLRIPLDDGKYTFSFKQGFMEAVFDITVSSPE